ncbi:MAG: hypothetical protein M3443_15655, partial [Actinomycetota bacterium]|nr:hypothetical protein [Actinomycetota bacterium]
CEQWNGLLGKPLTPINENEARRRHETGELYTAVGNGSGQERILVQVRLENGYVGIKFLDDRGRDELIYNFRVTDEKLFLRKIIAYTYDELGANERVPLIVESITYKPDGTCRNKVDDLRVDHVTETDYDMVDVDVHWEPIPSFGDYDSIVRRERD